jgi:hypothetical protein
MVSEGWSNVVSAVETWPSPDRRRNADDGPVLQKLTFVPIAWQGAYWQLLEPRTAASRQTRAGAPFFLEGISQVKVRRFKFIAS